MRVGSRANLLGSIKATTSSEVASGVSMATLWSVEVKVGASAVVHDVFFIQLSQIVMFMSGTGTPACFLRSFQDMEWEASIQSHGTHGTNGCLHLVRMTSQFEYGNHCPSTPLADCRLPVI